MFPEGTRSTDGEVKDFKDGAFRLAVANGCPVIPIAISGMRTSLPRHDFVIRETVRCVVRVRANLGCCENTNGPKVAETSVGE